MNGVLIVDKPAGPTSHDIVARARKLYGTRSIGHAGTLDPMATGVLVVLVGEATKLSPYLTASDKDYVATIRFGTSTDSFDAEGAVVAEQSLAPGWLEPQALERVLDRERGRTEQVPPAFSAIKVDGVRAHRASRRGETVTLEPRPAVVHDLRLLAASDEEIQVAVRVSKGFYVRSLARDLCEGLGVPGHLSQLRRVASGPFQVSEAHAWPRALSPSSPFPLIPIHQAARRAMAVAGLTAEGVLKARVGKKLAITDFTSDAAAGAHAWFAPDGGLVAVGEQTETGEFAVVRGFRAVEP